MTCAAEWRIGSSVAVRAGVEQLVGRPALGRLERELVFVGSRRAAGALLLVVIVAPSENHETPRPSTGREVIRPPAVPPAFADAASASGATLSWPR